MTEPKEKKLVQMGTTLYLYSRADAAQLENRLVEYGIDVNIKPIPGPPSGGLVFPEHDHDIVVVDLEYCGTEERTALKRVARLREGNFRGPIIINGDGNEFSSLLQIAGATHRVPVVHEEKGEIGAALAKTVRDVVKDIARYKEAVYKDRTRGQAALALDREITGAHTN